MPGSISLPRPYQPLVAELSAHEPEIGQLLLLGDRGTRQFVVAAMAGYLKSDDKPAPRRFAADLVQGKRVRVLAEIWKQPVAGWLPVLAKVGTAIYSPDFYAALLEAFQEPQKRKQLRHWHRPMSPFTLELLASESLADLSPTLLHSLNRDSAEAAEAMALTVKRVLADRGAHAMLGLKRCRNVDQVDRWYKRCLGRTPFPAPPWPGDEYLTPLDSPERIRQAAERFENCLESRLLSIHAGQHYYFTDSAMKEIVIELERGDFDTWYIAELNGPNNRPPRSELRKECRQRLLSAGFLPSTNRVNLLW